jgi:hypothetical protein
MATSAFARVGPTGTCPTCPSSCTASLRCRPSDIHGRHTNPRYRTGRDHKEYPDAPHRPATPSHPSVVAYLSLSERPRSERTRRRSDSRETTTSLPIRDEALQVIHPFLGVVARMRFQQEGLPVSREDIETSVNFLLTVTLGSLFVV